MSKSQDDSIESEISPLDMTYDEECRAERLCYLADVGWWYYTSVMVC